MDFLDLRSRSWETGTGRRKRRQFWWKAFDPGQNDMDDGKNISSQAGKRDAAEEACANFMYRYAFGIIGDEPTAGYEGGGIGTGVGLYWKGNYLILTAAHVVKDTPVERLYFLLPSESLVIIRSSVRREAEPAVAHQRLRLAVPPRVIYAEMLDLAILVLPTQEKNEGQNHFYRLDETSSLPADLKAAAFLGYPAAAKVPVARNFMATPSYSDGAIVDLPFGYSKDKQIAISYPSSETRDPHGFSGAGLWITAASPAQGIWAPSMAMIGILTCWTRNSEKLIGYRIETIIEFLKSVDANICARSSG